MSSVLTCTKLVSSGKSLHLAAERENTSATLSLSSNSPGILYKFSLNAISAIVLTWHVLMCPGERPLNLYCTCKASLLLHCIQLLPGNKRTDEESCCFALWRPWLPSQGNVAHNKRNTHAVPRHQDLSLIPADHHYSRMLFTFQEMLSITKETHKSCAKPCHQDLSVMPAYHHSSRMFWTLTLLGVLKAVAGILVTNHQTFLFSFQLVGILTQVWLLLILAWNLNIHL